jgi:serine/threonine protein kinase
MRNASSPEQSLFPAGDHDSHEPMLELPAGALGHLSLGRGLSGFDVGRLVLLRRFPEVDEAAFRSAILSAAAIAGPRLIKVLGGARVVGQLAVSSEYVEGIGLVELTEASTHHGFPVSPAVALRIMQDALSAVRDARRLFEARNAGPIPRLLFPETVWIAEFGEAFLTESGVIGSLLRVPALRDTRAGTAQLSPEELAGESPTPESDVFAAGALLWHLLAGRPLFDGVSSAELERQIRERPIPRLDTIERLGLPVPAPVVGIVERALKRDPSERYATPEEMGQALASLPAGWIATERQVREALAQLAPDLLDARRSRLLLASRESDRPQFSHWDAPTQTRTNVLKKEVNADGDGDGRPTVIHSEPTFEATTVRPPSDGEETGSRFFRTSGFHAGSAVSVGAKHSSVPPRKRRLAPIAAGAAFVLLVAVGVSALLRSNPEAATANPAVGEQPAKPNLQAGAPNPLPTAAEPSTIVAPRSAAAPDASAPDASAPHATAPKAAPRTEPSSQESAGDQPATEQSAPRKFRPRTIEPYRPKGI